MKSEIMGKVFRKRVLKIGLAIAVFSFIAALYIVPRRAVFSEREEAFISAEDLQIIQNSALTGDGDAARRLYKFYLIHDINFEKAKVWHDKGLEYGESWASESMSSYLQEKIDQCSME